MCRSAARGDDMVTSAAREGGRWVVTTPGLAAPRRCSLWPWCRSQQRLARPGAECWDRAGPQESMAVRINGRGTRGRQAPRGPAGPETRHGLIIRLAESTTDSEQRGDVMRRCVGSLVHGPILGCAPEETAAGPMDPSIHRTAARGPVP